MTSPSGSHHKIAAINNMGFMGGGNPASSAADMSQQGARIVSASSSVVSANSLGSSSTRASSLSGHGPAGGSEAIKNLMKQLQGGGGQAQAISPTTAPVVDEKKENEDDNGASSSPSRAQVKAEPSQPTSSPSADAPAPSSSSSGNLVMQSMAAPPHPVAEFLFQLTKMLTDNNTEYIEWRNASIFVHDPPGLEKDILPKYFRHSNYSSFQRQMNYFGFRKIAGKGKMAPCSYVNEHAKEDISSLLYIKRKKTGVSNAAAKLMAQTNRMNRMGMAGMAGNAMDANQGLMMSGVGAGSLNNFSMMGGVSGMGAGNMMSTMTGLPAATASIEQASLLRNQQNMLAQLQQNHAKELAQANALAAAAGPSSMGPTSQGSMAQAQAAAQSKLNGLAGLSQGAPGTILTNDQGNIYMSSGNPNEWANAGAAADAAAAQQLLLQQQGLAGSNFQQAMGGAVDSNGVLRVDSAANLRALINQQINQYQADPFNPAGAMGNHLAGSMAMAPAMSSPSIAGMVGQVQAAPSSQQAAVATSQPGAVSYEQYANAPVGVGVSAGATASLLQLEQQLMQSHAAGAAAQGPVGAAAAQGMGQSFGLGAGGFNGYYQTAGASAGAPQSYT